MNLIEYNSKCQSCYMLGVLADKELPTPISILNNSGAVICNIRPISVEPEIISNEINPISKSKYYVAVDNHQKGKIPFDYDYMPQQDKVEFWNESLKNKIICFRPNFNFDTIEKDKVIKNMVIEFIEDCDHVISDIEYVPIPVVEVDNGEFERKLKMGMVIDLKDYNHSMYQPEYIICGDYIYFNFQGWDKDTRRSSYWICSREANKIQRLRIDINDIEHITGVGNNLIFMRRDILMDIEDDTAADEITKEIFKSIDYCKNTDEKPIKNEVDFLNDFKKETIRSGLSYTKDDLVNLHTCVKTNLLTILAGMSGTGKSKLATMYSKMLNCTDDSNTLLFLPINPSDTEPGDLLGYLNNTTGIYMPSETRLVDFLNHASDNQNKMHIVIFDEMNLSQVEYWFAPFISLLERDSTERKLYLYNPQANCINKQQYHEFITIGDNVRFIGTVNVDETTKDFSDRLLDRANIIILQKQLFKTLKDDIIEFTQEDNKSKLGFRGVFNYGEYNEYFKWINRDDWLKAYSDKEIQFFDELHETINKYDTQKGVSFRIVKKIGEYLNNIPKAEDGILLIDRSKAFDLQVKQRIITKIKGTEKQFGKLIGTINGYDDEHLDSELLEFFSREEWKDISDFTLTKNEIKKKAKELGVYGYAN